MVRMSRLFTFLTLLTLGLTGCDETGPPLTVALIAPANDATVSGTTAVHATLSDDVQGAEVSVYARGRDTEETGRLIGNADPFLRTPERRRKRVARELGCVVLPRKMRGDDMRQM